MILKKLKLVSSDNSVGGTFPESGILYQCAGPDGYFLSDKPSGTVLCAFILAGKKILMAEQALGGVPGVAVKAISKGQVVSIGLCEYRVQFSKEVMRPSGRQIVMLIAIFVSVLVGLFVSMILPASKNDQKVDQSVVAKRKVQVEGGVEARRLDLLLRQDEGEVDVPVDREVKKSPGEGSQKAYKLYEEGLSLFDGGDSAGAVRKFAAAKDVAKKLPIVPAYMRMIDQAIARAVTSIEEKRVAAVAEVRASIDKASKASPVESLKLIAQMRAKFSAASMNSEDELLKSLWEELDKLHRSNISALLAEAHTLERLEGCRSANGAYREALNKYGSYDKLLAQEIQGALDRCGGHR